MKSTASRGLRLALAGVLTLFSLAALALPPGTEDEIRERIAPFGSLNAAEVVEEDEGPREPRTGAEVYATYCTACHATGVSGAPMLGDIAAWEPRIAKGIDALYETTFNGLNVMPPRGTCPDCTDDELRASVDHMVAESQ